MKKQLFLLPVILLFSVLSAKSQEKPAETGIRPAIIVIDIQNQYLPMVPEAEKNLALYMINDYIDYFRALGFPVIRVYHSDLQWGPHPDSASFQFPASTHVKAMIR